MRSSLNELRNDEGVNMNLVNIFKTCFLIAKGCLHCLKICNHINMLKIILKCGLRFLLEWLALAIQSFVWKNYYTTIFILSPTNSGAKISVFFTRFRICRNIFTLFLGVKLQRSSFSQKSPKKWMFLVLYSFESWTLTNKNNCFAALLVFSKRDMTGWVFPCLRNSSNN